MPRPKTRYIPSLDGLRALAVLAVILYHTNAQWAPGGLLGVTVFFVLSGYLITGLLITEWKTTKKIDLKNFWLRRARRLVPAIVFLLVCIIALTTLFNHPLLTKMRPDIVPSLFFYSNWHYIFSNLSYFDALGAPSPLTHFWSLAIEEQFYLVWPLIMLGLFKAHTTKKGFCRIIVVLAAASALAMALLFDPAADPSRVYYGTDTRAFSLLIGAWLAFVWPASQFNEHTGEALPRTTLIALNGCGLAALVGLLALMACTNGFSPFLYRGGILLASLLTAVIIAVAVHPRSLLAQGFAVRPLVWVGQRSYGLYLWHYPLLLLMNPLNYTGEINPLVCLVQFGIIVACAAFSYRFIENPVRHGAIGAFIKGVRAHSIALPLYARQRALPLAGGCLLAILAVGGLIFVPPTSAVSNTETLKQESSATQNATPQTPPPIPPQAANTYDILLIGDSVSLGAAPSFEATFPGGVIDSAVSRQLSEGLLVYDYYKQAGVVGKVVVFALGTNGPASDESLDELIAAVGQDKSIYLVNTRCPEPWEATSNEALARAAQHYSNVTLIDWFALSTNHDDWFDGDGTHLTQDAAVIYTDMIAQATAHDRQVEQEEKAKAEAARQEALATAALAEQAQQAIGQEE
ncbi:MAG: acyltransferase family protein [Raoultibacter sp.]